MIISEFIDKVEGFDSLKQLEQVKLLAFFYSVVNNKNEFSSSEIKECFNQESLKIPTNVPQCFINLAEGKNPTFLKKGSLYTFHRTVKKELDEVYLTNKHTAHISATLRSLLPKLTSSEQKSFLEEAVSCFEINCYRASIVMAWLLTMDAIYEMILKNYLSEFNAAIQSNGQYKKITISKKEDFNDIKEADFITLLRIGRIFSGDIRKILLEKLDFRNTAAHPNTIIIKESKAISFIEDLIENVILKIQ
ncbi:hypothetical protein [Mucilaginibacter aquariorum]|uniref:DUF4145 domain-containing protein n=1 Tax=Mucilaginibacter aquariorum TaxID=2967225 RepID=A0ABT1T716_9SPHI|nr:hypothetical protein [Mucilaginibacter aquariorum]MCQ6960423.1 hypothetical protein [Mucilaginibacter aquariorum]